MSHDQLLPVAASSREALCLALAQFKDQPLTAEVALQIVQLAGINDSLRHRAPACLPEHPTREQIEALERFILQFEQVDMPTTHHFSPGLYARELFIPADTVLTGDVHKVEHMALFVGDITVWTEGGMKRLTGHHTIVSKPGAKRVGYAHTDTWCTNFFVTDKTDVAEIERDICENPDRLLCNRGLIGRRHPLLIEEN